MGKSNEWVPRPELAGLSDEEIETLALDAKARVQNGERIPPDSLASFALTQFLRKSGAFGKEAARAGQPKIVKTELTNFTDTTTEI